MMGRENKCPLKHKRTMNPLQFNKCLADETRLRCILLIQKEHELCVCELMEALQESQPKISRHLAQLRECGLLIDRREGKWIFYRLNPRLPAWIQDVLAITLQENTAFITTDIRRLNAMGDRPSRQSVCC